MTVDMVQHLRDKWDNFFVWWRVVFRSVQYDRPIAKMASASIDLVYRQALKFEKKVASNPLSLLPV
jgi:hypothetical protein